MKRFFNWTMSVFILSVMLISLPRQQAKAQPGASVSFQLFYDELSPYGQWIDDPEYGYVWAPEVDNNFRPYYTGGRWVMTEYGNTWVSDYDWGWAPFHYGRWTYDSFYGWVWIPGNEWGPAWVNWRSGGGYYGWAPLGPGVNISISIGNYYTPYDWWTFIPYQHIYSPNYYSYWRGPRYNTTIINQTTVINNYYNNRYVYGPRRSDIERHTGGRVRVYDIRDEGRPRRTAVRSNAVSIYRPQVLRNSNRPSAGHREAPRNVVRAQHPISNPNTAGTRNEERIGRPSERSLERNTREQPVQRGVRPQRGVIDRQPERTGRSDRSQEIQRTQPERNRPENRVREQRERENVQRQNEQRMQQDRQRMERQQQLQRQQVERQQVEQRQRQMQAERQQQLQRQQVERQQVEQRQRQMQTERQQQLQRQQVERQQREWRRPEPRPVERQQQQRFERPQQQQREQQRPERGSRPERR